MALPLFAEIVDEREHQIDQPAREQRIGEIDKQVVSDEEVPCQADETGNQAGAECDHDRGRQHRRGNDDGEPEYHSGNHLGADRPTRRRKQRITQDALDDLSVHLDAGNHGIERRRPQIQQADGRGAHQHQFAFDAVGIDAAMQDIPGRHIALGIVVIEIDPQSALSVSRQPKPAEANALNAVLVGANDRRVGIGCHAQHFQRQRGHKRVAGMHDHRGAPDNSIALVGLGEDTTAGGGFFKDRNIAHQTRKRDQKGTRVRGAFCGNDAVAGTFGRFVVGAAVGHGFAEHDTRASDCRGKDLVIAGQAAQTRARSIVEIAQRQCHEIGRQLVRLGEDDVEADGDGAEFSQAVDQIGQDGARPRPLPDLL